MIQLSPRGAIQYRLLDLIVGLLLFYALAFVLEALGHLPDQPLPDWLPAGGAEALKCGIGATAAADRVRGWWNPDDGGGGRRAPLALAAAWMERAGRGRAGRGGCERKSGDRRWRWGFSCWERWS